MFLRKPVTSGQTLAENRAYKTAPFAGPSLQRKVRGATRRGNTPVRFSPQNHTPSFDGRQAPSFAALPVLFQKGVLFAKSALFAKWVQAAGAFGQRVEAGQKWAGCVVRYAGQKGPQAWVFPKSFYCSHVRRALRPAATRWVNRPSAVPRSVQVPQCSQVAVRCKVRPSARAQMCLRVRPNSFAAADLTASSIFNAIPLQAMCLRGELSFQNLFHHHHKGPAYVQ